jgi:hypothetical protein
VELLRAAARCCGGGGGGARSGDERGPWIDVNAPGSGGGDAAAVVGTADLVGDSGGVLGAEPGAGARVLSAASSDCGGDALGDSGGVTHGDLAGVAVGGYSVRCTAGSTCTGEAAGGSMVAWACSVCSGGGGGVEDDRCGRERDGGDNTGAAGGGRGGGGGAAMVDGGGESEGGDAISQVFKAAAMAAARYDEAAPLPLALAAPGEAVSLLGLLWRCTGAEGASKEAEERRSTLLCSTTLAMASRLACSASLLDDSALSMLTMSCVGQVSAQCVISPRTRLLVTAATPAYHPADG